MDNDCSIKISPCDLSDLIGEIYDSVSHGNWYKLLGKLADYTSANKAFCILTKIGEELPLLLEFHNKKKYPEQPLLEYQNRPFEDPFYIATKDMTEGDALFVNEYVDINQHIESEYYQTVFKPLECHYVIGGLLCRDGVHEAFFGLHRSAEDLPFSELDKNLVNLVTPHFRNAMRAFKDLQIYKHYARITDSVLDQTDKAIFVCNDQCNLLKLNKYAEHKLSNNGFFKIIDGKLQICHAIYQRQFKDCVRHCALLAFNDIGSQQTIVLEEENATQAVVSISPLKKNSDFIDIEKPFCLVSIEFSDSMPWLKLEEFYSFTPKEMLLLKGLYQRRSLRTLSESFGTSYNTLRVHLQNIFKKAQVNSQTELMIKLNAFKH